MMSVELQRRPFGQVAWTACADRDNAARIHLVESGDAQERRCPREPVAPERLAEVEMRVEDDQSEGASPAPQTAHTAG